jgi:hypothetical protein
MYYQHSGRFTARGVSLGLVVGAGGGAVVAYAYGAGLMLIPELHLAVFATMAFGALVGAATGFGLVLGRVRNKKVALAAAGLTSLVALYLNWAVWIPAVLMRTSDRKISWMKLAQHPSAVWYLMKWINGFGTWTLHNGKTPTNGWQLWIVWGLEAATVIALGMVVAAALVQRRPFCETCGHWCRRTARFFLAPIQDVRPLQLRLEAKDLASLEALGAGPKHGNHIIVILESCETCGQFHTLNVVQVLTRRNLGHSQVTTQKIVQHLLIGPAEAETIRQLSEKLALASQLTLGTTRGTAAGR